MAQDKNGNNLKPGMRVLIHAIIQALPGVSGGPITVKVGEGEALGSNIAVHGKHLLLHPEEEAVPHDAAYLKEAVKPKAEKPLPPPGFIEEEERKRKAAQAAGGPGTSPSLPVVAPRAPNDPNNVRMPRVGSAGDSQGGAATPHTTPDNATKVAGTDLPATGPGTL